MQHPIEDWEEMPEDLIISRILSGDTAFYELLIRRHNAYLYKIGRSYRYNHEDTEDLMQDTFIHAFINLAQFENRSTFKTWISRIMLNKCYHFGQKARVRLGQVATEGFQDDSIPLFSGKTTKDTTDIVMNKELANILETALTRIPLSYREVFVLREVNGHSVSETSDLLGISESNVKVRLMRAKAMLKSEIAKAYKPEDLFDFNLVYCDAMVHRVMEAIRASEISH